MGESLMKRLERLEARNNVARQPLIVMVPAGQDRDAEFAKAAKRYREDYGYAPDSRTPRLAIVMHPISGQVLQ
jgi:hypothetical protein